MGENSGWEGAIPAPSGKVGSASLDRRLYLILCVAALTYALLAGLRTVGDPDLGWQMATGRWVLQNHNIPSTEVLSYTADGQPWIYPVGAGVLFYAAYLLGGFALISWIGAAACTGTIAIMLRRGSAVTAALAIVAVPRISFRTAPRAELFTVVLFAIFLAILWKQHEDGRAAIWLLPVLMFLWVNLHLGFLAGLALLAGYCVIEFLDGFGSQETFKHACDRLRRALPWLLATAAATLLNPWGWGIYRALARQESITGTHSQLIVEWMPSNVDWASIRDGISFRNPNDAYIPLLLAAGIAVVVAIARRQFGSAALLLGASFMAVRHLRFQALFSVVVVIVSGAVLTPAFAALGKKIGDKRICAILSLAASFLFLLLVTVRSWDLITNRFYYGSTDLSSVGASFGAGLNWWFPENAAAFISRENLPRQLFNSYNEGGFIIWRLGPKYKDYIDGRAIPFGEELFTRNVVLMGSPPESQEWQREAARYDISTIIVPLAYYSLGQFPVLRQFCQGEGWRPVYLDARSAVFLRRRPETESQIQRLQLNCLTTPIPATAPKEGDRNAFHEWANAAAVLNALGRDTEALTATTKALAIFPDNAYVHFTRANILAELGDWQGAEQDYLIAATLRPNGASWTALANMYEKQGRLNEAIQALEQAAKASEHPYLTLLALGYDYVDAQRPKEALNAFNRASASIPTNPITPIDTSFYANLAHGRAMAWNELGDMPRAIAFQEETVRLAPERSEDWLLLARFYESQGRTLDAVKARARAAASNPSTNQ